MLDIVNCPRSDRLDTPDKGAQSSRVREAQIGLTSLSKELRPGPWRGAHIGLTSLVKERGLGPVTGPQNRLKPLVKNLGLEQEPTWS